MILMKTLCIASPNKQLNFYLKFVQVKQCWFNVVSHPSPREKKSNSFKSQIKGLCLKCNRRTKL